MSSNRDARTGEVSRLGDAARALTLATDVGLALLIFAAPLFMGGRHGGGALVYALLAGVTCVLWLARQAVSRDAAWRFSGAEWLMAAVVLLLIVQVAPLPSAVLSKVAPETDRLLPLWTAGGETSAAMGVWNQLSLHPVATRANLFLAIAYVMVFFVTVQRIESWRDAERLLKWIAASGVAFSLFGLAQYLAYARNVFWFYDCPAFPALRGVRSAFTNPNHFGHFAALSVGPILWWTHRVWSESSREGSRQTAGSKPSQALLRAFLPVMLGVVSLAVLMTFSRGAMLAFAVASLVCAGVLTWKRLLDWKALALLGGVAGMALAGVWIHGASQVSGELSSFSGGVEGLDAGGARRALWAANWRVGQAFNWFGAGSGTHREIYAAYLKAPLPSEMTHAESGYLQILSENGFAGVVLLAGSFALLGFWMFRALRSGRQDQRTWACAAAVGGALAASALQSVWDFVWFVPACVSVILILAAIVCRVGQLSAEQQFERRLSNRAWMATGFFAAVLTALMAQQQLAPARAFSPWQSYLKVSLKSNGFDPALEGQANQVDPLNPDVINTMIERLEETLDADPHDARAHVRLAGLLIRKFEVAQQAADNAMPLSQFRDAANQAGFTSRQQQEEWLTRAMGENRQLLSDAIKHARRGLQLCPLQGEAYVYLANLLFLEQNSPEMNRAYVNQGLKVRPRDTAVLFSAGLEALLDQDLERAKKLLKYVFRHDLVHQQEIIRLFALSIPPDKFIQTFEPDYRGLQSLYDFYRKSGLIQPARYVGSIYVQEVERIAAQATGERSAKMWEHAQAVFRYMGDVEQAVRCARKAVERSPTSFSYRRLLANRLVDQGNFDEAVELLRWCLRRSPHDDQLKTDLADANRRRLDRREAAQPGQIQR